MKRYIYIVFVCLSCVLTFSNSAISQAPEWTRMLQTNTYGFPGINYVTADNDNVYVAASIPAPIIFNGSALSPLGANDLIIQKIANSGQLIWSVQIDAQEKGILYATSLKTDAAGNLFLSANLSGTVTIGSSTVTSGTTINALMAKFDPDGNGLWATPFFSSGSGSSKIAIDASGSSYLLSKSTKILKFNSSGNMLWEQSYPDRTLQAIGVSGGNLYIGGALQVSTTFGTITLTPSGGYNTGYLLRSDLNGTYNASMIVGGSTTNDGSTVSDIIMDNIGNLIITGCYTNNLALGTITIPNPSVASGNYTYLAKCNNNFEFTWVRSSTAFSNPNREMWTFRLFTDISNNIFEYGLVSSSFEYEGVPVNPGGGQFLVMFDADGIAVDSYALQNSTVNKTYISPSDRLFMGSTNNFTGETSYGSFYLIQYDNSMNVVWQKTAQYSISGNIKINNVKHDAAGNTYLRSVVYGYCNFFGHTINTNTSLTIFSKHDIDGKLLWLREVADIAPNDFGSTFLTDKDNNIISIGLFSSSLTIGNTTLTTSNSGYEGYVAKFSPDGDLLWAATLGLGIDLSDDITVATDNSGNVLVSGTVSPANYLVKFDPSGNQLWAKSFPMDSYYYSLVCTDPGNNIYMATEIHLDWNTGSATIGTVDLAQTPEDGSTVLIKFDPDGNALWAKTYGGVAGATMSDGWPCDIKTDAAGNTYLWGWCRNNSIFGTTTLVNPFPVNQNFSFYLTKINTSGEVVWANAVYETKFSFNYGDLLNLDSEGNIYVGGHFKDKIKIDSEEFTPEGTNDFFTAKFSNTGSFQWIKTIPANYIIINSFSINDENTLTAAGSAGKNPTLGDFVIDRKSGSNVMVATMGTLKYLTLSSDILHIESPANSSKTFEIKANTGWTLASDQSWLAASISSGSGDASVKMTAEANSTYTIRNANIKVTRSNGASQTIIVTQSGLPAVTYPYTQDFSVWPDNWDFTGGTFNWLPYNSNSSYADFRNHEAPENAMMTTQAFNFSGLTNPQMNFKWSHKYDPYNPDKLKVEATVDGVSWITVWEKSGDEFDSNDGASDYEPGTFVTASVNLLDYAGSTYVKLRFNGISADGPNAFIDDVSLFNATVYAPEATTLAVTSDAILNGVVNANSLNTTVSFEYGITTSYGSTINASPAFINGDVPVSVSAVLNDINANETYHYRVKAESSAGTDYGDDMTFTPAGGASVNYSVETIAGSFTELLPTKNQAIVTANFDNANSSPQEIGFTFRYNCQDFTQFILNTNGFIKLGSVEPSSAALFFSGTNTNDGIFSSSDPLNTNILSPLTMDLTAGTLPTEYRVSTTGTAPDRVCTIQFKNVRDKTNTLLSQYDNMIFQLKLYETTNVIEFVFGPWTPSVNASASRSAECGLKGSNNTDDHLITVTKASVTQWGEAVIQHENYSGNALNFGNPPSRSAPDAGRTFRFMPEKNNDAKVAKIYGLTKLPVPGSGENQIKAVIENTGLGILTDINVTLEISGANAFSNSTSIASLKPGANEIVTFDPFSPVNSGLNTIEVTVEDDDNNANNKKSISQSVNSSTFSYSDANPVTQSLSITGLSLTKFQVEGARLIAGVNIYLSNLSSNIGNTVYAVVVNSEGTIVGKSSNLVMAAGDIGKVHNFVINAPPVITNSDFYVGLAVTPPIGSQYFPLAMQNDVPLIPGTYYTSGLLGGTLIPLTMDFRFVMEAVIATPDLSVSETSLLIEASENSTRTFSITSNTSWTATCDQSWLTLSRYSGSGNSSMVLTAILNPGTVDRQAIIKVTGSGTSQHIINVTQSGLTTLLSEISNPLSCKIFPNPNDGKFRIRMENPVKGRLSLAVTNFSGIVLRSLSIENLTEPFDHEIDLGDIASGVYFIHIQTDTNSIIKKLIIR